MGLIKRAPDVQILLPRAVFVGEPCRVEIVVEAREALDIEYIDASIVGEQGWSVSSGKHRVREHHEFPRLFLRLMEAGTLPAGTTRLAAGFDLPEPTPPSHDLRPAWATLELRVRIAIPWWPDGRYRFTLPVRKRPPANIEHRPFAARSTRSSADADAPRLELSLASSTLIAGETIVGSFAVYHVDDRKPRKLELTLVPHLELYGARTRQRMADAIGATFTLPAGSAGTDIRFRFDLPATTPPTFTTYTHSLRWVLMARSGSFFGGRVGLALPVTIVDAAAAESAPQPAEAPRLAERRVEDLFERFATVHGWQRSTGDDGALAIEHTLADAALRIAHAYRGERGTFVVSTIEYPSLGLDVVATPSSPLRHLFFEDVEVDIAEWDRKHHVVARNAAQAIPFLRKLVPTLQQVDPLGALVRLHDDAVVFERAIAALDDAQLASIAATLELAAHAIASAADEIPPPPEVTVDLDAWRSLARSLDGRLGTGDLSIDGTLDGLPVALGLEWRDGAPRGVRASVGAPGHAGDEVRALSFVLAVPAADVLAQPAAEPLIGQLVAWPRDVGELRVHDGVASALLAMPAALDTERVRTLVEELRIVLAALAPARSPYR